MNLTNPKECEMGGTESIQIEIEVEMRIEDRNLSG